MLSNTSRVFLTSKKDTTTYYSQILQWNFVKDPKKQTNSLTSQGKLSWLCVRCAQPRTTLKPTKKARKYKLSLNLEFFRMIFTDWLLEKTDSNFKFSKVSFWEILARIQAKEEILKKKKVPSPRLDFNFYPIVRLQNRKNRKSEQKTWCVLVLLLPLCYPFCSFGKKKSKISSNIHWKIDKTISL